MQIRSASESRPEASIAVNGIIRFSQPHLQEKVKGEQKTCLGCVSGVISTWSCVPTEGSVTCYSFAMTGAYNSKGMGLSIAMLMKFTGLEVVLGCSEQKLKPFRTVQSLINEVHDNFVLRVQ